MQSNSIVGNIGDFDNEIDLNEMQSNTIIGNIGNFDNEMDMNGRAESEQDDGRKGSSTSDVATGNADIAKQQVLAVDDHSESENAPDTTDSFIQEGSNKK